MSTKELKASQASQLLASMWDVVGRATQHFKPVKKMKQGYHTPSKEESSILVAQLRAKALKLKKDEAYAKMRTLFVD